MKFTKTVDLWNPVIAQALMQGNLKLQCGQWISLGENNPHKSRFIGINKQGIITAAHWQGSGKATNNRFHTLLKCTKH